MATLAAALSCVACDNREAIKEPDPTWARMLSQRRADAWEASSAFADGKVMQRPPAGTVPTDDDIDSPPPEVTRELLLLGHARFDVMCAVCHGVLGDGASVVATKMSVRPPPTLIGDENRRRSRKQLYTIVTEGFGVMSSYADLLSREERWAVVAYLQALQLSQHASVAELPAFARERLSKTLEEAPR